LARVAFLARQFFDYEPGIHYPNPNAIWYNGHQYNSVIVQLKTQKTMILRACLSKNGYRSLLIFQNLIHEPWKLNPIEQFIIAKEGTDCQYIEEEKICS
jgi:hypothetical protein